METNTTTTHTADARAATATAEPAECGCIDAMNAAFQRDDDMRGIFLRNTVNRHTGFRKPVIAAERRVGKGRKAPPIIPTFCPFCGIKYGE